MNADQRASPATGYWKSVSSASATEPDAPRSSMPNARPMEIGERTTSPSEFAATAWKMSYPASLSATATLGASTEFGAGRATSGS